MSSLNHLFRFVGLLPGYYDGEQLHTTKCSVWRHRFVFGMFIFETLKHGAIVYFQNPDLYMYLGDIRFSSGPLHKASSSIVSLYCLFWSIVFFTSGVYSQRPQLLHFLKPILWPEKLRPIDKHGEKKRQKSSKTNLIATHFSEHRLQKFVSLVHRIVRISFQMNWILTLSAYALVFRSTFNGLWYLSQAHFWFICLPCSLSSLILCTFMSAISFLFTLIVFLSTVYFIQLIIDERHTQRRIGHSRTNLHARCVRNCRILKSLHRLDDMLKERLNYVFFVQQSYSLFLCPLLVMCNLMPFLIFFEQNPLYASLGLTTIYVSGILTFFATVCLCNSIMHDQVSVGGWVKIMLEQ